VSSVGRPPGAAGTVSWRAAELAILRSFLDEAATIGGAFVLSGEAGIGKTALLDVVAEAAAVAGTQVVRAVGVEYEAEVSFSGLNQVLLPVYGEVERLGVAHRDALAVALGFSDGPAPDRLVVFTAAVALMRQAAAVRPLLLVVDDSHWLDRVSAAALAFAARRLAGSRAGLLVGSRSAAAGFFDGAGLPGLKLNPLSDAAAEALVRARFPNLAPRVRRRLLAEAQGNPLALLELPGELSDPQRTARQPLPSTLPLSRRLQELFAARILDLSAATRQLLLLAILDGTGDLGILAAADPGLDNLVPAEQARLVHIDHGTHKLAFGHPLVRSAVVGLATSSERRQSHRMLAELLPDQPERQAWHFAEASVVPDEHVAMLLEQAAYRILRRGDALGAVASMTRAAAISPNGVNRSRRLAEAAYLGADVTGELRKISPLLAEARRSDPDLSRSLEAAAAAGYLLLNQEGDVEAAHRLLAGAIETRGDRRDAGDTALIEALHTLLSVCLWAGRADLWQPLHTAIAQLRPRVPPILDLQVQLLDDPVRTAAPALSRLDAAIENLHYEADPTQIVRVGIASLYVDRVARCRPALWRVVRDGRQGGAVAAALSALGLLCVDDFATGQWDHALALADEGLRLSDLHGYRLSAWPFRLQQALIAAARGDYDATENLAEQMTRWGAARRVGGPQTFARHARTLAALGQGDFEKAYQQAAAISPAGTFAPHVAHALSVPMYLVEAAARTGRRAEADAHVTAMREASIASLSPRLALLLAASAAVAAPDDLAGKLCREALALPGTDSWPFDLAYVQLACGERLRRARATTAARTPLARALSIFERLGARPWARRAAGELRATGHSGSRAGKRGPVVLTPQEREVVMLAVAGLTNKQIAERIFVSPRTVGAHLYRVFPRLGVTSRAALRDALDRLEPDGK
jgi:DNA-binding CsgD family transcriptional regulator